MLPHHGRYDYVPITGAPTTTGRAGAAGGLHRPQPRAFRLWRGAGRRTCPRRAAARRAELRLARLRQPRRRLADARCSMRWPARPACWPTARCTLRARSDGRFRARGDEVVGHGRTNSERQSVLTRRRGAADRRGDRRDRRGRGGARRAAGCRPWIAESRVTPDLLREAGYGYTLNWCMDDQPVWMRTRAGRLLAIPYPQELNDIPSIVARKDGAAASPT
jgi:allantoinase